MEMNVSEDRTEASAVLPGFAFGDLDRTGAFIFLVLIEKSLNLEGWIQLGARI